MKKNKKERWDGRSRLSTPNYRKGYSEITWKNIDEISKELNKRKEENLSKDEK